MWESRYGFGEPFVDVDEWRDHPTSHRYVHGGFEGTHTRFSFYFPPEDQYDGRFYQYLEGAAGGHDGLLAAGGMQGEWIFDLAFGELGGYLVESNQGHFHNEGTGFANDVELYGASAESARYAAQLAADQYGSAPHHGYVWGASGGGSRAMYCLENEPDVYAGAVPLAATSSGLMQQWSSVASWWLHARHKLAEVVDATSPGGNGNPFEKLTNDEREALAATYRHGYPRGAESQLWSVAPWLWAVAMSAQMPYYRDFWQAPGYLGHDSPWVIDHLILVVTATVGRVVALEELPGGYATIARAAGAVSEKAYGITLEEDLPDQTALFGAKLTFMSGQATGRSVYCTGATGSVLETSGEMHPQLFDGVAAGDEVRIDNHDFLAWCYLHRYLVDTELGRLPEFGGLKSWTVDGTPVYPQLRPLPGKGTDHTGRFSGKMIHVNATHDSMVWPNGVAAYHRKVEADKGEATAASYRLWWVENAPHAEPELLLPMITSQPDGGRWRSELVSYDGVTSQALRDLTRWVEEGVEPPPSTGHWFTEDGGLVLAGDPRERRGVQPLALATANGAARAEVRSGEVVHFVGVAEQPPGAGTIVAASWDFEGTGTVDQTHELEGRSERVSVESSHAYDRPGTYFASFRVGAHRDGADGRGLLAENLARVRVVVS